MGGLAQAWRPGHLFTSAFSWGLLASCGAEEWMMVLELVARVRGRTCNNLLGVPSWSPTVMFCVEIIP